MIININYCAVLICILSRLSCVAQKSPLTTSRVSVLAATLPPSELSALHDFYFSTNGPGWVYRKGPLVGSKWNFTATANPCTQHWQGVACQLVAPYYHVHSLSLASMRLRGPLSSTLDALTHLTYFSAPLNDINGSIIITLSNISSLQYLDLSSNDLTGTIPSFLSDLWRLESLDLSLNRLTGTIPVSLSNLTNLQAVDVGGNQLHGPLPCWLADFTELSALHLYRNRFSGGIPECLCNFSQLTIFDVSGNQLSGPVPSAIGNMSLLDSLFLYDNKLTGALPSSLGALAQLLNLELYSNLLTGTIPPEYGALAQLQVLALYNNTLSGTLPASLGALSRLQYFYVDSNRLSGSLPASFAAFNLSQLVDVHQNQLTGTVPAYLGSFSQLGFLALHDNALSGSLPASLCNLTHLQELQVQDNHLTGSLTGLFSHLQKALGIVQVENNRLTGELPAALFALPVLTTVVAVGNCLHGRLPPTLCDGPLLEVIVLDGASSAPACRSKLLPGLSRSYTTQLTVYGTVPACLFSMPHLTTLHLSGNGLTGPLPDVAVSQALVDLTLSHNLLTGEIPAAFQQRQWFALDLSYNRLSGSLRSDFASAVLNQTKFEKVERVVGNSANSSQLYLENNRLSGRLPASVQQRLNISVLGTNVFECALDRSDLPRHDPGRGNYQCGSDSFDVPYFLWLALAGTAVLAIVAVRRLTADGAFASPLSTSTARLRRWAAVVSQHARTSTYYTQLLALVKVTVACTMVIVLMLLPLYVGLSSAYGTVTHAYAWQSSAAFLSGTAPAACELVLWVLLMAATVALFAHWLPVLPMGKNNSNTFTSNWSPGCLTSQLSLGSANLFLAYALFMAVNLMVVVGVNAAFVYVAIYQSSGLLIAAQVLISLFKLVWNNFGTAQLLRATGLMLAPSEQQQQQQQSSSQPLVLLVCASLLNNIVIPCLVVAVISPDCFYDVLDAAPAVSSQFSFPQCVLDDNFACVTYTNQISTTTYDPPFRYSYQCSTSFITYYAPAYVILCLVVSALSPALQVAAVLLHQRQEEGSWVRKCLETLLPPVLLPDLVLALAAAESGQSAPADGRLQVGAGRVLVIVVTFFGLVLTFGAVFPPLAATLALSAVSTFLGARAKVGRLLERAIAAGSKEVVTAVEDECAAAGDAAVLHASLWMVVVISCWFYALFLFDTLGAAVGFNGAFWVLVVMPLVPAVLYAVRYLCATFATPSDANDTAEGPMPLKVEVEGMEVELQLSQSDAGSSISTRSALHVP